MFHVTKPTTGPSECQKKKKGLDFLLESKKGLVNGAYSPGAVAVAAIVGPS
jgi:hypothetical protein